MGKTLHTLNLEAADALFIVPPFASIEQPSIGVHLLQAILRRAGYSVRVLYGNLALAALIGEDVYTKVTTSGRPEMVRERFFSTQAYGVAPPSPEEAALFNLPVLHEMNDHAAVWVDLMEQIIFQNDYRILGSSSTFEQTSSSIAVLNRAKARNPELITIMGGANCEYPMSEGIHSLKASIDYVFSGESEETILAFFDTVIGQNRLPQETTFRGKPCRDMDNLPTPDFTEFFEQYHHWFPESKALHNGTLTLSYESSRGCWWGQKNHCTFCGLNGGGMAFREKSPERVVDEILLFLDKYGVKWINMVDNIMPHRYFKTLLHRLAESLPEDVSIFYEQKSNINLEKAILLKKARVTRIQPGIEAINTDILKLMRKGVTANQNLNLLRYGRSLGIFIDWNLLTTFPGDRHQYYVDTLNLMRLIPHLQPPNGASAIALHRFSPYFEDPERYGIRNVRPKERYKPVFPAWSDIEKIAYTFDGDFESGAFKDEAFTKAFLDCIDDWQDAWALDGERKRPILWLSKLTEDHFMVSDSRGLPGTTETRFINAQEAAVVLLGAALHERESVAWALDAKLLIELDGRYAPLAVAPAELMLHFEKNWSARNIAQEELAS